MKQLLRGSLSFGYTASCAADLVLLFQLRLLLLIPFRLANSEAGLFSAEGKDFVGTQEQEETEEEEEARRTKCHH